MKRFLRDFCRERREWRIAQAGDYRERRGGERIKMHFHIFPAIIAGLQVVALVFGIVGVASTGKGWASASGGTFGWQQVCSDFYDLCVDLPSGDAKTGGEAGGAGSIIALILAIGIIILMGLATFGIGHVHHYYTVTAILLFLQLLAVTICWIIWVALTHQTLEDSDADPAYAFYLLCVGVTLVNIVCGCLLGWARKQHQGYTNL